MREPKGVIVIFLFLLASIVLQSTLFEFLNFWYVRPDLCLLVVIFAAIKRGSMAGMVSGFTAGMLEGFFTFPYGLHALTKTILGYVLGRFEGILSLDTFLIKMVLVVGATIVKGVLNGFTYIIFGIANPPFCTFVLGVLLECLYNALLAPVVFFLLKKMKPFKEKETETL